MSDDKHTRRPAPLSKSYTLDGDTTEFNPWKLQIHEFSPELRRHISELEKPRLDPQCLEDTLPPAGRGTPPGASGPAPSPELPPLATPAVAAEPTSSLPKRQRRVFDERWRLGGLALIVIVGALYLGFRDANPSPSKPEHNVSSKAATVSVRAATASTQAASELSQQPPSLASSKSAVEGAPRPAEVIEVPSPPPPSLRQPTAPRAAAPSSNVREPLRSSSVAPPPKPRVQARDEYPTNLNVAGAGSRRDPPSSNLFDTQLVPPID